MKLPKCVKGLKDRFMAALKPKEKPVCAKPPQPTSQPPAPSN